VVFDPSDLYEIIVMDQKGKILATNLPEQVIGQESSAKALQNITELFSEENIQKIRNPDFSNRSFILSDLQGRQRHISFSASESYAIIVSFYDSVLWRSALPFLLKSWGIFIILIGVIAGLGHFASRNLILDLKKLGQIMNLFRTGNLKVRVKSQKQDEVSQVAVMFDGMADDIVAMMSTQQQKAALEKELELAQEVQKKMLPIKENFPDFLQFGSFIQSATTCGGDWLFYHVNEKQFIFLVGDVTGHGVAAAFLTSAARAAFAAFEVEDPPTPAEMLRLLNRAIFNTSQGGLHMTMLIGSLDLKSLVLSYASASHEVPFVIQATPGKLKSEHFIPLNESRGPRLGEFAESEFMNNQHQMNRGEFFYCLSDGMYELQDLKNKIVSDRSLIRMICRKLEKEKHPKEFIGEVMEELRLTNDFSKLKDDLSFIMWKI
jgi:serine phosphatase RsbU (regulator of sigma subunit)